MGSHDKHTDQPNEKSARVGVIKAVREEVAIGREQIETGRVRVTTKVDEHTQLVDEPAWSQVVQVERVPMNRVVDGPVPVRTEGDTTIVPVLEEQLVIERRLVLKEEVRITRRQQQERVHTTVPLREETVIVERVPIRDANEATHQPKKGE